MKIIISINTTWNVVNFRSGLIKAFLKDGHEVVIFSPADGFEHKAQELGCRHIDIKMENHGTSPVGDFKLFLHYLKILRQERPQAFLGFTIKPNVYGSLACSFLNIPVINNISGLGTAFIRQNLLTKIVHRLYRVGLKNSSKVFFQNNNDRELFLQHRLVQKTKTGLLPGSGIDLKRFQAAPCSRDNHALKFLMIARLLKDKGVVEFVDAARKVKADNSKARFQLLGFIDEQNPNGVSKKQVDDWVAEGIIEYLGSSSDVREQIAPADCVVLPSYREGTPRTLLEAAAMAKPLIATDVPGCREVVDDGENGFLCTVRDADSLAKAAIKFIKLSADEKQSMATASRKLVEERFDETLVIDAYQKALADIA